MQPNSFAITDDGRALLLHWPDASSRIAATLLWTECPSARQRRRRLDGAALHAPHDLAIVRVAQVGRYAINIAFSDGHDRGIYPWSLLLALARRPTRDDFIDCAPANPARG